MAEPERYYRLWRDGARWRWEVASFLDKVIASGVADSSAAAREAAAQHAHGRRMFLYFFHLRSSSLRDTEGQEFPDDEAARSEAAAVARDLSRNQNTVRQDCVVVTNADGIVVHEEPLVPR
jgi:hypothetical protein